MQKYFVPCFYGNFCRTIIEDIHVSRKQQGYKTFDTSKVHFLSDLNTRVGLKWKLEYFPNKIKWFTHEIPFFPRFV